MNSERWKQVEGVFEQALGLSEAERARFVQSTCAGDAELQREVEAMLHSHETVGEYLNQTDEFFTAADSSQFRQGERIDRYRILREIGRGGIGIVFLAERADEEFEQLVALKIIKRGMDSETILRHFRVERQILARLNHPNIARLIDGGTTESGLPYFVMEYVAGPAIDEYCRAHALSIDQRLKLFREVCAAVSHAHSQLIVHRDIKRSNILVTNEGVPKLLDFGIAKILQEGDATLPLVTAAGQRLMTPEYASPEQIRGEPVTPVSDVYSLGVILYELLCGHLPFEPENQSPAELARVVTESEPKKPSTITAQFRQSAISSPRALRGDLDNIALMALRKEPSRRYQSVEQFSEDIRRYLENRPVFARRDTLGYRAGKFVRRNRLALAAAALIMISLVAGVIATSREARIAQRRFNDVRQLAHSVLFDYHDAIKTLPGATKVREQLVKDALRYLDSLALEAHGDSELQRELAAGYERIGDVRGGLRGANLGDTAGAAESYTKALRIREALVARRPRDVQARRELAGVYSDLGICLLRTAPQLGLTNMKKARALLLDLSQEQSANDDFLFDLGNASHALAVELERAGDLTGALEQQRAAALIAEKLVARKPQDKKIRLNQLIQERSLALSLWKQQGDEAGARAVIDQALISIQVLITQDPYNTSYQTGLFHLNKDAGSLRAETDPAAALTYFRTAAEVEERLLKADPANAEARTNLADLYMNMGRASSRHGNPSDARSHYETSAGYYEKVANLGSNPNRNVVLKAATARAGAAAMGAQLGALEVASEEADRLRTRVREIPEDPSNLQFQLFRAETYEYLGYAYRDIAAFSKEPDAERKEYIISAGDMFRRSTKIFADARNSGGLDAADGKEAKSVADELAKCEAALK